MSAREVERFFALHVTGPWPALAMRTANTIGPEDVRDVLARMVRLSIKRQTNVLRSYLQAAFAHGAHADLDPRRAANDAALFRLASNPVTMLPRIAEFETTRDQVLTDDEFRFVWSRLATIRPEIALALRSAILLGGQRFKQLLRLTWGDYDEKAGVLRLVDAKGKRSNALPHYLPVSARVRQLLADLRVLNPAGPYVFSTTRGEKSIHATSLPAFSRR